MPQEIIPSDAEDAIELVQSSPFAGRPEDAAMQDFRAAGSRRGSKQACATSHNKAQKDLHNSITGVVAGIGARFKL